MKRPLAPSSDQQPSKRAIHSALFVDEQSEISSSSTSQTTEIIRVPNNWEDMNRLYHSTVGYPKGDELKADQSIPKLEQFMKVCVEYVRQHKDENTFIIEELWFPRFKRHLAKNK